MLIIGFFAPSAAVGGRQSQHASDGSTTYQAGRDLVVQGGVSVSDARALALDVFRANFVQLAGVAESVARGRAAEITEAFLTRMAGNDSVGAAADPGVQRALFEVQRAYACSGDTALEQTLINLLVDRADDAKRFEALVLDEAIVAAPKLTSEQRRALAVSFVLRCQYLPQSIDDFYDIYLERNLVPLASELPSAEADYRHIEYVGAASIQEMGFNAPFNGLLDMRFFNRGFTEGDLPDAARTLTNDEQIMIQCPRDDGRLQLVWGAASRLEQSYGEHSDISEALRSLDYAGRLSKGEISSELMARAPDLRELIDVWQGSDLSQLHLTTVGLAIGHAYWRRFKAGSTRLGLWLSGDGAESWPRSWT